MSLNPGKNPPCIEPRQAYVIIKNVERRYAIVWIIAFAILLVVNIIAVLGGRLEGRTQDSGPADEVAFLDGADEVMLEWWPETENQDAQKVMVGDAGDIILPVEHAPDIPANGPPEVKDYHELMAKYIENLERYLAAYFRITRMVNGVGEK